MREICTRNFLHPYTKLPITWIPIEMMRIGNAAAWTQFQVGGAIPKWVELSFQIGWMEGP